MTENGRVYIKRLTLLVISNKSSIYVLVILFGSAFLVIYMILVSLDSFSKLLGLLQ